MGKRTPREKHFTKPYEVGVICKEIKYLAGQAVDLREQIKVYKAAGVSRAGDTNPTEWFNARLTHSDSKTPSGADVSTLKPRY